MVDLEHRVRMVFNERATELVPTATRPQVNSQRSLSPFRNSLVRVWVAAGAALLVATLLFTTSRLFTAGDQNAATTTAYSNTVDLVDGILVQPPVGFAVTEIGSLTDDSSRYCFDLETSNECAGIQLIIGRTDDNGLVTPLALPSNFRDGCNDADENLLTFEPATLGNRTAQLYRHRCGDTGDLLVWQTSDGSMILIAPRGKFAAEASSIAEQIDLTGWKHQLQSAVVVVTPGG